MRNVQQYWQEVRSLEAELPEFVWLAPLSTDGSTITEVQAGMAARLLQAKSHRRATPEEITRHHAAEQFALREERKERMRKAGRSIVVVQSHPAKT